MRRIYGLTWERLWSNRRTICSRLILVALGIISFSNLSSKKAPWLWRNTERSLGTKGYFLHISIWIRKKLAKEIEEAFEIIYHFFTNRFYDVVHSLTRIVSDFCIGIFHTVKQWVDEIREEINNVHIQLQGDRSKGNQPSNADCRSRWFQKIRLQFQKNLLHQLNITNSL